MSALFSMIYTSVLSMKRLSQLTHEASSRLLTALYSLSNVTSKAFCSLPYLTVHPAP